MWVEYEQTAAKCNVEGVKDEEWDEKKSWIHLSYFHTIS